MLLFHLDKGHEKSAGSFVLNTTNTQEEYFFSGWKKKMGKRKQKKTEMFRFFSYIKALFRKINSYG
jgi:hypothetical protein